MRFEDTKFACIDFETTGFSPKSSRAIELAIIQVQHGENALKLTPYPVVDDPSVAASP